MTLRQWFERHHTRPLKTVAIFLLAVWSVFAVRSYLVIEAKQSTYVKQTADLLSIAVYQRNRVLAESLLETLLSQGGATSAEVCEGNRQQIGANAGLNGCQEKLSIYEKVVEQSIPGSGELKLRTKFNLLTSFSSVFSGLGFALILVFIGFYFIQTAQNRIKKDLFDPLLNKLLGNDQLEITELMDLRRTIKEAKELEAQKAVTLAIQENNQQVAHDIRSPIQSINALLKMIEINDSTLRAAFEKAVLRANSVANFLLKSEKENSQQKTISAFDMAAIIEDIATEKRPLFVGGEIKVESPKHLFAQSQVSAESISRILSNIVDNAILACDHERKIKVGLSHSNNFVEVSVQDSGCGIPDNILNQIGEKGFSQREQGTGRGVYSVKRTLEEVGGGLYFSSKVGAGTTVTIRIPLKYVETFEKLDFVLIDNEEIHRLTWKVLAQKNNFLMMSFSSVESFLEQSGVVDRSIPLFLDSDLDGGKTGQSYVPHLRSMGFRKIVLMTAHKNFSGDQLIGIDAVIEKDPAGALDFIGETMAQQTGLLDLA